MGRHALGVQRHGQRVRRVSDRPGRRRVDRRDREPRRRLRRPARLRRRRRRARCARRDVEELAPAEAGEFRRRRREPGAEHLAGGRGGWIPRAHRRRQARVRRQLHARGDAERPDARSRRDARREAQGDLRRHGQRQLPADGRARERGAKTVRLRLHKHSTSGLDFALDLNVGLTGTVPAARHVRRLRRHGVRRPRPAGRPGSARPRAVDGPEGRPRRQPRAPDDEDGPRSAAADHGPRSRREVRRGEGHRARHAEEVGRAAAGHRRRHVAVPVEEDAGRRCAEVQVVSGNARRRRCRQEDAGAVERAGPGARGQAGAEVAAGDRRSRDPRGRAGSRPRQRARAAPRWPC